MAGTKKRKRVEDDTKGEDDDGDATYQEESLKKPTMMKRRCVNHANSSISLET